MLVDEADNEVGTAEKLDAHRRGLLHRAFSVLIYNERGEMLLQRRAAGKYHSPGLWSNACCGHPRPSEEVKIAARRRLREELGVDCDLAPSFTFLYKADVGGGLTEHEYDHVFTGRFTGTPTPNADEVDAWRWIGPAAVEQELSRRSERYTPWFRILMARLGGK